MGTRAVIRMGKFRIATHWDGYPSGLGLELLNVDRNCIADVVEVAERHTIDFISQELIPTVEDKRWQHIVDHAKQAKDAPKDITVESVKKRFAETGKFPGTSLMSAGDWPIESFDNYGDFAEYEYDVREDDVYCRELSGSYNEALDHDLENKWKPVSEFIQKEKSKKK